jgi:hypothetical protein
MSEVYSRESPIFNERWGLTALWRWAGYVALWPATVQEPEAEDNRCEKVAGTQTYHKIGMG